MPWTALKLARWSNRHSHGGEIYMVHPQLDDDPVYVGSYAAQLKRAAYDEGWRLFRASRGRDTVRGIQSQLDSPTQVGKE